MYQTWSDLLFLHARVPAEKLQSMVPEELEVETFDGSAWLGFVPFRMRNIHPRNLPIVPWLSAFAETNIRTYVTHPVHGPGVWFLSLDASRYVGCYIARRWFSLPYFHGSLAVASHNKSRAYVGNRYVFQPLPRLPCQTATLSHYKVVTIQKEEWRQAEEETFEFWLAERYRLYSMGQDGQLRTAQVYHPPYQLAVAEPQVIEVFGLDKQFGELEFSHALMAKSLNVECFSPILVQPDQPS